MSDELEIKLAAVREQFESLPYIQNIMLLNKVNYVDLLNNYVTNSTDINDHKACSFVNGAWYAYQEQEKMIDAIVGIVREAYLSDGNSSVAIVHDEIQELLK